MNAARPLRFLMSSVVALLFWPPLALAVQSYTVHLNGVNGAATRYVSQSAVRYVVPDKKQDMIIRLDKATIIHLDHERRSYSEVGIADMRQAVKSKLSAVSAQQKAMLHQMGFDLPPSVTKLGPGESVAGFATERYLVKTAMMEMEVSAAPALQVPPGYYDVLGIGGISRMFDDGQASALNSIAGCVMKQVITSSRMRMAGKAVEGEMVTSVDVAPVAASQFAVPAGYQKKEWVPSAETGDGKQ